jgi:hypothetical protein
MKGVIVIIMNDFSVFYCLTPSSKQKVAWFVLFTLLFIQIRVAVGGCLVTGYIPAPQKTEQTMQMEPGEPCTENNSTGKQPCMKHCEQSTNTPKFTFDLPLFAPLVLLTSAPMFILANAGTFETPAQTPATTGPPIYLRFLRLLN